MTNNIDNLHRQWQELELELLVPVQLQDNDFAAALLARKDPMNRIFRERLPLTVARFKENIQQDIMKHKQDPSTHEKRPSLYVAYSDLDRAEDSYKNKYASDINKIHTILFGVPKIYASVVELRVAHKARTPCLHQDGAGKAFIFAAGYVARIGSLPCWCISGKDQLNASTKIQTLINDAHYDHSSGKSARETLRESNILTPLPLGDVALILTKNVSESGTVGTLHCSSPYRPQQEHYSAFFRAQGQIFPQNIP